VLSLKQASEKIGALETLVERVIHQGNIEREFLSFYHTIFQSQGIVDTDKVAMQTGNDLVPHKVSLKQERICDQHSTLSLTRALMAMVMVTANNKSPSLNEHPCDFFMAANDLLGLAL
jgi:hypothetical protein